MSRWIVMATIMTLVAGLLLACAEEKAQEGGHENTVAADAAQAAERYAVSKPESEWKRLLPPETFHVMREHGTESPFRNRYDRNKEDGVYYCAACGQKLYDSKHKFDSGTGWPSFFQPIDAKLIGTKDDYSFFGSKRTEIHCSRCGGHLGHVFDDGPKPTGLRYCMNSASLNFRKRKEPAPPLLK